MRRPTRHFQLIRKLYRLDLIKSPAELVQLNSRKKDNQLLAREYAGCTCCNTGYLLFLVRSILCPFPNTNCLLSFFHNVPANDPKLSTGAHPIIPTLFHLDLQKLCAVLILIHFIILSLNISLNMEQRVT
jgi:hypothetical protein